MLLRNAPSHPSCGPLLLSRVMGATPDEMRLSRQTSLQGALTSKRWCVAVWGFRLVGLPSRERRERFMRMAHFKWPERGLAEGLLSRCALLRWGSSFQIAEQASEGLLVVVVVLPAGEVGNVSHTFDMCCPTRCALHDGIVKANGKEYQGVFLILFGKGGFDLEFYPRACDRVLREHQQQLVVLANGLIDALPDLVASLHVFWGKPAAHAFALQVGIQPVGKLLVAAGIANEAGVVLDGMSNQGVHIGEEILWHTGFAQKCFGNASLGAVDGVNTNARWAFVLYCFQSFHGAQIDINKICPSDSSTIEVGMAEGGTAEVGTAEVGMAEGGTTEGGTAEVGTAEVGKAEVGTGEVGTVEISMVEISMVEAGMVEVGTVEVDKAEVGKAEVRLCCFMQLSPRIPTVSSLLEYVKLVLICHVGYLLCSALIIERCGYDCKHVSFCFSSGDRSSLVLVAKCFCSLRHNTSKPCLSKYMVAWWC